MRVQKGNSLLCLHPSDSLVVVDGTAYVVERGLHGMLCELRDVVAFRPREIHFRVFLRKQEGFVVLALGIEVADVGTCVAAVVTS